MVLTPEQQILQKNQNIPAGQAGSPWTAAPTYPRNSTPPAAPTGFSAPAGTSDNNVAYQKYLQTPSSPDSPTPNPNAPVKTPIYGRGDVSSLAVPGLTPTESGQFNSAKETLGTPAYTVANELQNEQELLSGRRAMAQDEISKIMQGENAKVNSAEKDAEYGAAAGGMMGSPNAGADIAAKVDPVRDQSQAELAKILLGIDQQAESDANLLQQQNQAQASGDIKALNDISTQRQAIQSSAQETFANLAKNPTLDYDSFINSDYGQTLMQQSGYDATSAALVFNSNQAPAKQIQWDSKDATPLADGTELIFGTDPTTGQIKKMVLDPAPDGYQTTLKDGLPYYQKIDPTTGKADPTAALIPAPLQASQQTPDYKNYLIAKSGGYTGNFTDYQSLIHPANVAVSGSSTGVLNKATGQVTPIPGATGQNGLGATLGDFFNQYAPPSDGNDPVAYTNAVATALGVDPSTPLTQLASRVPDFSTAIATHEGFFDGSAKSAVSDNNPGALNFANQPGATQDGRWAKFPTLSAGWTALQNDIQSRIEQASGLSSGDYTMAEQLANGQLGIDGLNKVLGGGNSSNPTVIQRRSNLLSLASQINPNFNEAQWEQGQKFGSNPTTQKTLAAIGAVDKTFGIISGLVDNAVNTGIPALNKIVVPGAIDIGDVSTSNFATTATALADELSGVLGYGSATDMKLQLGIDLTNPTQSPQQFKTNLETVKQLVQNRKQSLQAQIWQGTGAADSGNSNNTGTTSSGFSYSISQ